MLGLQPTGGLTAQVGWLGLKVGGHLALIYICEMNQVNSRSDFVKTTANKHRPGIIIQLLLSHDWRPA